MVFNMNESAITMESPRQASKKPGFTVAGLFAGIGGIELGLSMAGHRTQLLCEIEPGAQAVLRAQFPDIDLVSDVRTMPDLPAVELLAGGFPCQDLSQAGRTVGITGENSGLVGEVFRLLEKSKPGPKWLMLENVTFMLQLDGGEAMRYLTDRLNGLGYRWAYRVVDSRAFGLPQRRQRVILLASRTEDPREVLFVGNEEEQKPPFDPQLACGFYWTEGSRGLGWAVDAIPTLKGGSTIGIPSAPAIWMPDGSIITPDIRDAERLQGFPAGWTEAAIQESTKVRKGHRWKLVGNAVSVNVAKWVGERLQDPRPYDASNDRELLPGDRWPKAAWGQDGRAYTADYSMWPVITPRPHLTEFLTQPGTNLSVRATEGFYKRAKASSLNFVDGFLDAVASHLEMMKGLAATPK